jgi:hypothetical protein
MPNQALRDRGWRIFLEWLAPPANRRGKPDHDTKNWHVSDTAPSVALGIFVTIILAVSQSPHIALENLLVSYPDRTVSAAMVEAKHAHAVLVSVPALGFAVFYGDGASIQAAEGRAAP